MRPLLVAIAVVMLLAAALAVVLARDAQRAEPAPVDVHAVETTSTTAWPTESVPDLGDRFGELVAASERAKVRPRARTAPTTSAPARAEAGAWGCGGDLPPCWVLDRENPNRDLTAYNGGAHHPAGYLGGNPEGDSTASGKWQFLRSTWNGFGGFVNAADAPWQVQDAKARQVWAGGRGCSHWAAC